MIFQGLPPFLTRRGTAMLILLVSHHLLLVSKSVRINRNRKGLTQRRKAAKFKKQLFCISLRLCAFA